MARSANLAAQGTAVLVSVFVATVLIDCLGQWGYKAECTDTAPDSDASALFDYVAFYYCSPLLPDFVKTLGLVLWLLVVFMLLSSTADLFFVPTLEKLSNDMGLSEEVAGITLLALGNGMPDVMSAFSSINKAQDFDLVMGDIFGAACFLPTICLGAVLLCNSGKTALEPKTFLLITLAYLVEISFIVGITWDSSISVYESLGFFVFYAIYVFLVVQLSQYLRKRGLASVVRSVASGVAVADAAQDGGEHGLGGAPSGDAALPLDDEKAALRAAESDVLPGLSTSEIQGPLGWLAYVLELPFSLLRHLSIPAATWSARRRWLAAACPFFAAIICLLGFGGDWASVTVPWGPLPAVAWAALFGCIGAALVLRFSTPTAAPRWHVLLVALSLLSVIAWFNIIANECVAILETFGLALNISSDMLGITVLAWGNCIGDLVADTALARSGQMRMAVAGVFGSLIFNDCLGLGSAITSYTLTKGNLPAALSLNNEVAGAAVMASVATTVLFAVICKFSLLRSFAAVLFVEYLGFMVVSVCLAASN